MAQAKSRHHWKSDISFQVWGPGWIHHSCKCGHSKICCNNGFVTKRFWKGSQLVTIWIIKWTLAYSGYFFFTLHFGWQRSGLTNSRVWELYWISCNQQELCSMLYNESFPAIITAFETRELYMSFFLTRVCLSWRIVLSFVWLTRRTVTIYKIDFCNLSFLGGLGMASSALYELWGSFWPGALAFRSMFPMLKWRRFCPQPDF